MAIGIFISWCCCFLSLCCYTQSNSIDLVFAAYNCDELPRSLTAGKSYNLTWDGQITPRLCSFSFNSGSGLAVCFQSMVYELDNLNGVQLKIKNYTKQRWEFDQYDSSIPHTCVNKAYKLNISIVVPRDFQTPVKSTYLKLQLTAEENDLSEYSWLAIVVGLFVIGTIAFCIFCFVFMFKRQGGCSDICECLGNVGRFLCNCCEAIGKMFSLCCSSTCEKVQTIPSYLQSRRSASERRNSGSTERRRSLQLDTTSGEWASGARSDHDLPTYDSYLSNNTGANSSSTIYTDVPPPSYEAVVGNTRKVPTAPLADS